MEVNFTHEQIRDEFKKQCLECYKLAENEIQDLFNKIGLENKCNQGFLYEELRNTPNRNKYFTKFFLQGPSALVSEKGYGSKLFYECTLYSQKLGLELYKLTENLESTLECDEI